MADRSPKFARFNVLLTEDRPHADEHWSRQLARLLEPQGVAAVVVRSGQEALAVAQRMQVHAAVIDLATPMAHREPGPMTDGAGMDGRPGYVKRPMPPRMDQPTGLWLLELFRRLPQRPPVVVLRGPADSPRQAERLLRESLRLGAFSVVDKPVDMETLLAVFARVIARQHRGNWPGRDDDGT